MLVSRCHRLVKSLETLQEKICEFVCGRPGDKNNSVVLWEGKYSLIRWCFAIPVQGTQTGGCYTGTSIAVNSFPGDSSAAFAAPFSFSAPLALAEPIDPIPCPQQGISPMGWSLIIPNFRHPIMSVGHWARSSSEGWAPPAVAGENERHSRGDRARRKDSKQEWHSWASGDPSLGAEHGAAECRGWEMVIPMAGKWSGDWFPCPVSADSHCWALVHSPLSQGWLPSLA